METVFIYLGLVTTTIHHRVVEEQVELEAAMEVTAKIRSLELLKAQTISPVEIMAAAVVAPALHGHRLRAEAVKVLSELFGGRAGHSHQMRHKEKTWKFIT